jgi:hypothetical protein
MPKKKKPSKSTSKVTPPPPPSAAEVDSAPVATANESIESDAPPAPRRSTEAASEGGDVERLDNEAGLA